MAKPTGPLISFNARGSIGRTAVFSSWRGRQYVRQHVIPANPNTAGQQSTRNVFKWLQAVWKVAGSVLQAPWTAYSSGQTFTNRNAFTMHNLSTLRGGTTVGGMIFSPGAGGGLAATGIAVTSAANQVTISAAAPAPPSGWTLSGMSFATIQGQDPHSGTLYNTSSTFVASGGTLSATFTGLTSGHVYEVGAWPVWSKPGGVTAYGPSLSTSATSA